MSPKTNPRENPGGLEGERSFEAIRREHVHREGLLHGLGTVFSLLSLLPLVVTLFFAYGVFLDSSSKLTDIFKIAAYSALLFAIFWGGIDMRDLSPRARITGTVSCISITVLMRSFGIPFALYALYLLHSGVGRRILDAEYRDIRAQTPQISSKVPMLIYAIAAIVVAKLFVDAAKLLLSLPAIVPVR